MMAPLKVKSPALPLMRVSAPKVMAPDNVAAVLVLLVSAPPLLMPVPDKVKVLAKLLPPKSSAAPLATVTWPRPTALEVMAPAVPVVLASAHNRPADTVVPPL